MSSREATRARLAPLLAQAVALIFTEAEPRLGDIAYSLQRRLHFCLLRFHRFAIRIGRNLNHRSYHEDGARKWMRNLKLVPGFLQCVRAFEPDVKNKNRLPSAPRQNHGAGFRDVARPARPINCKCDVLSFFQFLSHRGEAFDSTARRASLRRTESQALDDAPRPLAIEIHRI